MADNKLIRKLQNALKLSGFIVRREFCTFIIENFSTEGINLEDSDTFEECIKNLSERLEKQCVTDKSIEKEHIDRAIKACLHSGCDKHETIISTVNAFDFPKTVYEPDRKLYILAKNKSTLLSDANSKAQMFVDRYTSVLHRTQRNFKNKLAEHDKLTLQNVDFLLTLSYKTLDKTLILGSLLQVSEGKYYLEDPTGMVQLDLTHAKYHGGFFVENCFVLLNGFYEDKILHVSTIVLPPGEEYKDTRPFFGNINYFGGISPTPLRESHRLKEYMLRNPQNTMLFFSDVWLDHPLAFEKLEVLFNGIQASPPVAFIFMGNFMSESRGSENIENLKKLFKQFGELISAGAFEVTAYKELMSFKDTVKGKSRLGVAAYAEALLVIPKVLATNSGFDAQDTIVKLQEESRLNPEPIGLDLTSGEPIIPKDAGIYDNYIVKKQIINSCSVIASNLLLVDEIMRAGMSSLKG